MTARPWETEPDSAEWIDQTTGLRCWVFRHKAGSLFGQVECPEGAARSVRKTRVYGGAHHIGYNSDGIDQVGFDCAHWGDLSPFDDMNAPNAIYRDFAFVRAECASLARQLAALAEKRRTRLAKPSLAQRIAELTAAVDSLTSQLRETQERFAELTAAVDSLTSQLRETQERFAEFRAAMGGAP